MQHIRYIYTPEAPSGLCFMVRILAAHSAWYRVVNAWVYGARGLQDSHFFSLPTVRTVPCAEQCRPVLHVDQSWSVNSADTL